MEIIQNNDVLDEIALEKALEERFGNIDIDKILSDTTRKIKEGTMEYLTHEEVFANARRAINKSIK